MSAVYFVPNAPSLPRLRAARIDFAALKGQRLDLRSSVAVARLRELAIDVVLRLEGTESDAPADPGGLTKFGIASTYHPQVADRHFDINDAKNIYRQYWMDMAASKLAELRHVPALAVVVYFGLGVNVGVRPAQHILQAIAIGTGAPIVADGVVGPMTLQALVLVGDDLPKLLQAAYIGYQVRNVTTGSSQKAEFAQGWYRRMVVNMYDALLMLGYDLVDSNLLVME